jgi:hypothetical protein
MRFKRTSAGDLAKVPSESMFQTFLPEQSIYTPSSEHTGSVCNGPIGQGDVLNFGIRNIY